ncbi:MAG: hypothetical protein AAGM38_16515, partial [Pseudomonadota bacterium]
MTAAPDTETLGLGGNDTIHVTQNSTVYGDVNTNVRESAERLGFETDNSAPLNGIPFGDDEIIVDNVSSATVFAQAGDDTVTVNVEALSSNVTGVADLDMADLLLDGGENQETEGDTLVINITTPLSSPPSFALGNSRGSQIRNFENIEVNYRLTGDDSDDDGDGAGFQSLTLERYDLIVVSQDSNDAALINGQPHQIDDISGEERISIYATSPSAVTLRDEDVRNLVDDDSGYSATVGFQTPNGTFLTNDVNAQGNRVLSYDDEEGFTLAEIHPDELAEMRYTPPEPTEPAPTPDPAPAPEPAPYEPPPGESFEIDDQILFDGPGTLEDIPGRTQFIGDQSANVVRFDETWEQVAVSRHLNQFGNPSTTIIVEKLDEFGEVIPGETDYVRDVEALVFAGAEGSTNDITLNTDQIPDDGRRVLMASSVGDAAGSARTNVNEPEVEYLTLSEFGTLERALTPDDTAGIEAAGGDFGDSIGGGGGQDRLLGGDGNDYLEGGAGDDVLEGGDDNDTLDGGAGDDILVAGSGDDWVFGGEGADTAVFEGDPSDYDIYAPPGGGDVFVDAKGGAQSLSGLNWLQDVETLQFGFGASAITIPVSDLPRDGNLYNPDLAPEPSPEPTPDPVPDPAPVPEPTPEPIPEPAPPIDDGGVIEIDGPGRVNDVPGSQEFIGDDS